MCKKTESGGETKRPVRVEMIMKNALHINKMAKERKARNLQILKDTNPNGEKDT